MHPLNAEFNEAFEITNAFIWEGSGNLYSTSHPLEFEVHARSHCEHSGDFDGICNQVEDLRKETRVINNVTYAIQSLALKEIERENLPDGEFNTYIKGNIKFKIV